jgi:hypothetical protein
MTLTDIISKVTRYAKKIIVTDNSSDEAVSITQLGSGPALAVEDGKVVIGTDTLFSGSSAKLQILGFPRIRTIENSTSASGVACDKARGTTSSPAIVQNGDTTGFFNCLGYNGTSYQVNAEIVAEVDGVPSAASMPGRIRFSTAKNNILSEAMRIENNGYVGIGENNPQYKLHVNGSVRVDGNTILDGTIRLDQTTQTTVGAAGAASALPANPTGYLIVNINGTDRKVPFYNT